MEEQLKETIKEQKILLERAASEIKSLRRTNEIMDARLSMFNDVMSALHGSPARNGGGLMSPDIVYDIEKQLRADKE